MKASLLETASEHWFPVSGGWCAGYCVLDISTDELPLFITAYASEASSEDMDAEDVVCSRLTAWQIDSKLSSQSKARFFDDMKSGAENCLWIG